ncbi:tritrans,polycis-undecaprenyl-diphosphate synthase (geranylgeranyl-diphosphate specific) [Natronomonas moolapensis 8.8.11]|uniref:Tritrans,polycis-undecaprenyl-diphosphate synthase (geranylgeranyl-diphosphate specific) n=1 Tax=Natronomonas moolapensis (strain DSM 18674 / CECT 7526 / JCM 14361 / 8.8.11) TaxID=268739 RepID=M1XQW1_NATM8|nr:tritrans,polycis-undecaprenyl-diphosphate synthase (geranylgeranyl-diphosphate specific) [Natronomonas moolapensis 8.8.11]
MLQRLRGLTRRLYERVLEREVAGVPAHVAVIQDGNRRYAREHGEETTDGHRAGADTTERVLEWCADLGVEELTLYAFSTENFERPPEEREALFDLIAEKLRTFADRPEVHDRGVRIRAIGETERLPQRVREAVAYAEGRTDDHDAFRLNVALAYGGRAELLGVARDVARSAAAGECDPGDVTVETIEDRLTTGPTRDVDLIIRTGGAERTSNFLPWHANGNEAAVYFCAPYWPEFSRIDFLRAIRTYESRRESWRKSRAQRAAALVRAAGDDLEGSGGVAGIRSLDRSDPEDSGDHDAPLG